MSTEAWWFVSVFTGPETPTPETPCSLEFLDICGLVPPGLVLPKDGFEYVEFFIFLVIGDTGSLSRDCRLIA